MSVHLYSFMLSFVSVGVCSGVHTMTGAWCSEDSSALSPKCLPCLCQASWLTYIWESYLCLPTLCRIKHAHHPVQLYEASGNPNSGPQACIASAWLTELCPAKHPRLSISRLEMPVGERHLVTEITTPPVSADFCWHLTNKSLWIFKPYLWAVVNHFSSFKPWSNV